MKSPKSTMQHLLGSLSLITWMLFSALQMAHAQTNGKPEDLAKSYILAIEKSDHLAVLSHLNYSQEEITQLETNPETRGKTKAFVEAASAEIAKKQGVKQITIHNTKLQNGQATVEVQIDYNNGTSEAASLEFMLADNQWKLH